MLSVNPNAKQKDGNEMDSDVKNLHFTNLQKSGSDGLTDKLSRQPYDAYNQFVLNIKMMVTTFEEPYFFSIQFSFQFLSYDTIISLTGCSVLHCLTYKYGRGE